MPRTSTRTDFSTARFLTAARFVALTRGLMDVSYATVSAVSGATRSSIQRRFPTVEQLRRATLETWLHAFTPATDSSPIEGVAGAWGFVSRWLLAYAEHPAPFTILSPSGHADAPQERHNLASLLTSTLGLWCERLERHIATSPEATWREDTDAAALARHVALACFGVGVSSAVFGEVRAIECAARCSARLLVQAATLVDEVSLDVEEVVRRAEQLIARRPALEWVQRDAVTARSVKPRSRGPAGERGPRQRAPATWDDFLSGAINELDEYRRRHPDESEAGR